MSYINFVNQEVDEWRCQDGGLTHAACDVIQTAHWLVKVGGPIEEDHFSEDFATQYASRLWEEHYVERSTMEMEK